MDEKLIIYLDIDVDDMYSGMDAISFVNNPATEISWQKFSSQKTKHKFEKNDLKMVVTGPVMLAETPIYRYSETYGEYYIKFSEQTIFNMMIKYFRDGKIHNVNENHNPKRKVDNVTLIESYILGDRVSSNLFSDLPKGTWMASFKIEDEEYWNNVICSDEFNGFSLEGYFIEKYEDSIIEDVYSKAQEILNSDKSDELKFNEIKRLVSKPLNIK